jgi:hypothetical protein
MFMVVMPVGVKNLTVKRVTIFSIMLLLLVNPARARDLCMTDSELRSYLRVVFQTGSGITLGSCARRFPIIFDEALAISNSIEKSHSRSSKADDENALRPFQRAFSGSAVSERDKFVDRALRSQRRDSEQLDLDSCRASFVGIKTTFELYSVPPNSTVMLQNIDRWIDAFWLKERTTVPKC